MKLVRSFDEFVGESTVNEAADKFKLDVVTPNSADGEVAHFKLVLREFDPQKPMADLVTLSALAKPEFSKFAKDASLIGFITVTKQRDKGFLTPRDLIKAIVVFKKAEGFDVTKATPLVNVEGVKLFNSEDAVKMKSTETKIAKDTKIEVNIPEPKTDTPQKAEEKAPEYDTVKDVTANAEVLAFLKSKLLNGETAKFSKSNKKVSEVKGTQAVIAKFTLADKKTPSSAANYIKKSGIDGIYGDNTAIAISWITPENGAKPVATIDKGTVEHLAKWCTFMGMTKADLEKIFKDNEIKTGGGGGDQKPKEEGPKYYFVNKGWTYSAENDPYKTK